MDTQPTHDPEVTVLVIDSDCPDNNTCRAILDAGDPEFLHMVVTDETDQAMLVRLASRVGPGERLVRWPRRLGLPEVPPG
jgi:hypothetical protein